MLLVPVLAEGTVLHLVGRVGNLLSFCHWLLGVRAPPGAACSQPVPVVIQASDHLGAPADSSPTLHPPPPPPWASPTCYSRPSEHLCLPQSLTAPTDAPSPTWCGGLAGTSSSVCWASVEMACAARCSCGSERQVPRILSSGSFPHVFLVCRPPCSLPALRLQTAWLPPAPQCQLGGSSAPHGTPSPTVSPSAWRPAPCVRGAWCLLSLRALPWEGALPHWTPLISVRFWLTGGAQ